MIYNNIITLLPLVLLFCFRILQSQETQPVTGIKESVDIDTDTSLLESDTTDQPKEYSEDTLGDTITLSKSDTRADSITLDSLKKIERRDTYIKTNKYFKEISQQFPQTIDSIYNPYIVFPFQVFHTDGMNLSEIIHFHPLYTSVPVGLASNCNSFLFYGFPGPHVVLRPNNSMFDYYTDPTVGPNFYSAGEIKNLYFPQAGTVSFNLQPYSLRKPETVIFWETGVFEENTLNIRFARPIAENIHLGIFSNYCHLARQNYDHKEGDINNFYRKVYDYLDIDTSYVSDEGINPLTSEHVSSGRITWILNDNIRSNLSYKYADLHNDIATEYIDTVSEIAWFERSHYGHTVRSDVHSVLPGKKLLINAEAILQKYVNRLSPVSINVLDYNFCRGESILYGGAIKPSVMLCKNDTLSFEFSTHRNETERYNKSTWVTHHTRNAFLYVNNFTLKKFKAVITGKIGHTFVKLNGKLEYIPLWKFSLTNTIGNQSLNIFVLQDIISPFVPYDTAFHITPGKLTDRYQSYGMEGMLRYKKAGLLLGVCSMNNVNDSSLIRAWPDGVPPYKEPQWVFNVTPQFGRWYGLAFSSQWLFSDKKPNVKTKNIVSYHYNREGKSQHLFIDLGYDYWSKREHIFYGGFDKWNRPIHDLYVKTTVQIKTFRLFYKIDNIFNGNFAYLPGYKMPGLVFRWGFNWLIQG